MVCVTADILVIMVFGRKHGRYGRDGDWLSGFLAGVEASYGYFAAKLYYTGLSIPVVVRYGKRYDRDIAWHSINVYDAFGIRDGYIAVAETENGQYLLDVPSHKDMPRENKFFGYWYLFDKVEDAKKYVELKVKELIARIVRPNIYGHVAPKGIDSRTKTYIADDEAIKKRVDNIVNRIKDKGYEAGIYNLEYKDKAEVDRVDGYPFYYPKISFEAEFYVVLEEKKIAFTIGYRSSTYRQHLEDRRNLINEVLDEVDAVVNKLYDKDRALRNIMNVEVYYPVLNVKKKMLEEELNEL